MDNNQDVGAGDPDESKRELTGKQLRFAAAYADPNGANGNATLAARMAGYKGGDNQLAVQGSVNLKNKRIRQTIAEALEAQGCTLERAAVAVAEATHATKRRSFVTKNGDIVYTEAEADHKVRLLAATIILRVHGQQHDDEQQPGNPHQEADPGTPAEEAQLDPADRVLFEQATKIEAELAKVDRELDDGGHGTDQ